MYEIYNALLVMLLRFTNLLFAFQSGTVDKLIYNSRFAQRDNFGTGVFDDVINLCSVHLAH
jgi:hypothetical protein